MARKTENELRLEPLRDVEKATWIRALYSERQLEEVLVGFWHDHFNVHAPDPSISPVFVSYDRDVIRAHAFGNFREMLEAVATSPAMLFYLDGYINQSGNPNENYARELFELHTLGAENYLGTRNRSSVPGFATGSPQGYVDGDVYEAARCFTGWRVETGKKTKETGEFAYFDPWHDRFQKIVLGHSLTEYQPPMKDGRDVLDLLARHPGTARFVSRKLCARFVSDTPPERLVEEAARVFHEHRESKDQIRRVLRVILLSPEFGASGGRKLKRPFEFLVSALRALEAEPVLDEEFFRVSALLGQRLFQWRTPDGYPEAREKWTGAAAMINRWRVCNQLVSQDKRVRVDWERILPGNFRDSRPDRLAASCARRILGHAPSASTAQALREFAAQAPGAPLLKARASIALTLMSPEFQWK